MANFQIKTKSVHKQQDEFSTIADELVRLADEINSIKSGLAFNGAYRGGVIGSLGQVADRSNEAGKIARDMGNKLGQIVMKYETAERKILSHASGTPAWNDYAATAVKAVATSIGGLVIDSTAGMRKLIATQDSGYEGWTFSREEVLGYTGVTGTSVAEWSPGDGLEAEWEAAYMRKEYTATYKDREVSAAGMAGYVSTKAEVDFGLGEDGKLGGKGELGFEAAALKGEASYKNKYGSIEAEAAFLMAETTAEAVINLTGDNPNISLKTEAKVAVAAGEVEGQLGTDAYNVHGKASGSVLGAEANAGISMGANGVKVGAGAEAYLAKGEIEGGFTIFGIKIDGKLEGKAGAIGGNLGAEAGEDSVKLGAGISALLGVGLEVEVDWSEFSPPSADDIIGFLWGA